MSPFEPEEEQLRLWYSTRLIHPVSLQARLLFVHAEDIPDQPYHLTIAMQAHKNLRTGKCLLTSPPPAAKLPSLRVCEEIE